MKAPLKRLFRGTVRAVQFFILMLTASLGYRLRSRHRRHLMSRASWLQRICGRLLKVLHVKVHARGLPAVPTVIVANHLGYLDVLVLGASAPVVFVAKREVSDWPVFGWFARMAGTRFIDRESRKDVQRVADELRAPLEAGVSVVLFLEGTSTDGTHVLPFRSSLLEPAVQHQWKVTPVTLSYSVPDGHSVANEVCWWGDMTLAPHLANLFTLPWIAAEASAGDPISSESDRKKLAARLHAEVLKRLALQTTAGAETRNASRDRSEKRQAPIRL